jgi:tape measure domain-containing protein
MYASVSGQVPLGNAAPRLPAGNKGGALALRDAGAQTPLSLDYYKNAFKYSEALKVADASARNFSASQIPLIGGIKNLAGEFGQATKQVLIYGTAYKGLAFLTSLPGQILNAAKSQQQFANGLKVATQDTGTFGKELLYVDNVQRAFGLNLETTRAGFTRLYASMAPTGFDSGSIEKLFTGISAATASLQLTPDKAERVIYAFGQMASKGQIMSEELKGQLGDVLPGALAIFSKAAGMSVKEFSKAMEDGEFVGNRFREVFAKVSDELMNRFGTGAQAAGRSLQGLINTVGGDFQRVLESFSPLANSAAQAILGPLGGSLKQLALSAQIATGEIERVFMQLKASQQDLQDLRTTAGTDGIITADEARQIKAAEQNVAALTAKYKSLQQAASDPAIAKQAQDITKFTEELGKAGTFVMNVAKTIGGILSPALNFLGTNLTTVISLITSFYIGFQAARLAAMALMGVLLLYRTLSAILGFGPAALSANALATAFSGLGIAATGAQVKVIGLRLALTALVASTVIGAVVGGIMLIAGAFASMRDRAKEASQSSRDAAKAAIDAASTGGVAQAAMSVQTILGESRKAAAEASTIAGGATQADRTAPIRIAARFETTSPRTPANPSHGSATAIATRIASPVTGLFMKHTCPTPRRQ